MGYSSTQNGYPTFKRTFISKDAFFDENAFFFSTISSSAIDNYHSLPTKDESTTRKVENSLPQQYPPLHLSEALVLDQRTPDQECKTSAPRPTSFTYFLNYYVRRKTMELTNHSSIEANSTEPINNNLYENSRREDLPLAIRKHSHTSVNPRPYAISSFLTFDCASPAYKTFLITLNRISIPKAVDDTLKSTYGPNSMQ